MKIARQSWAKFRNVAGKLSGDISIVIEMSREMFHGLSARSLLHEAREERSSCRAGSHDELDGY
jgi:hypothetical protein